MFEFIKKIFGGKPVETVAEVPYKVETPVVVEAAPVVIEPVVVVETAAPAAQPVARKAPAKKRNYTKKSAAAKTKTPKAPKA